MSTIKRHAQAVVSLALLAALCACGGNGGGTSPIGTPGYGYGSSCDPGTSVSLAAPAPNSYNGGGINSLTIVASGNNNALYNTYSNWILEASPGYSYQNNSPDVGTPLALVADPGGPHPYASDYYYQSSIGTLPAGQTWTVLLANQTYGCAPIAIGSFNT